MDVRLDGRLKFSNTVYAPAFEGDDDHLVITADLKPTMVDPTPGVRFDRDDPREGAATVMVVHDGKGTPEKPRPPEPAPALKRKKAAEEGTT
jgi:hypothetical protein